MPFDYDALQGPQWTDVSISDVAPLPVLPDYFRPSNPRFLHRSYHSQVYLIDLNDGQKTFPAIVKVFPRHLKHRYTQEVDAYRFLYHYNVPSKGVVPKIYGVLPSVNKKKLRQFLQDTTPEDAPFGFPGAALVMEYIEKAERPSSENMSEALAREAIRALRLIHRAHVLHEDPEPRNILLCRHTGKVVWIDFSSAEINTQVAAASLEQLEVKQKLWNGLVDSVETVELTFI